MRYSKRPVIAVTMLSLCHVLCLFGQEPRAVPAVPASTSAPLVTLSISDEVVRRGDRMRVWFGTATNAHVSIVRVDTDGRLRMLYPERPWHNNYVQAGRVIEVRNPGCDQTECAFIVDDFPGQGYIFAIVSTLPLEFDAVSNGDYWDYSNMAHRGRVAGDPFRALNRLMDRIVPESSDGSSSYDVYEYYVEQRFDYPRFLCYECHSFVRFTAWNPYEQQCTRYQVLYYVDPAYQSASGYPAERVVLARPKRIDPKYIFTERIDGTPFVSVANERTKRAQAASPRSGGITASEVGGIGAVPAPLGRRGTGSPSSLLRLTQPDSSTRENTMPRIHGITPSQRLQPRLLRRRKAKPDTSGVPEVIKPHTL